MDIEQRYDLVVEKIIMIISIAGCVMALLILSDYLLPGKIVQEQITNKYVESSVRSNGRYSSYVIQTTQRSFTCEKDFYSQVDKDSTLDLNISLLFNAVNSYQCTSFMNQTETHSLRIASGLFLPVLMLILALVSFRVNKPAVYFIAFIVFVLTSITFIMLI